MEKKVKLCFSVPVKNNNLWYCWWSYIFIIKTRNKKLPSIICDLRGIWKFLFPRSSYSQYPSQVISLFFFKKLKWILSNKNFYFGSSCNNNIFAPLWFSTSYWQLIHITTIVFIVLKNLKCISKVLLKLFLIDFQALSPLSLPPKMQTIFINHHFINLP